MNHKLIGIGYQKQSGKDTAANLISELFRPSTSLIFHFADELKAEVSAALGISITEINNDKQLYRPLLQWWGGEYRRGQSVNYWISKLEEQINFYTSEYKIIADVRYRNEAEWVKSKGGILIEVKRVLITTTDPHPSENEGKYIPWDWIIYNTSDLNNLRIECKIAVDTVMNHF